MTHTGNKRTDRPHPDLEPGPLTSSGVELTVNEWCDVPTFLSPDPANTPLPC